MSDLPPIELTESLRRKISTFFYQFHVGRGGRCIPPRVTPSDRLCQYFGYARIRTRRLY